MIERRLFQFVLALAACVPIFGGLWGIMKGISLPAAESSHFHYLSGLLLAIGLAFESCVIHPETKTERFRLLAFIVVVGGIARLVHTMVVGYHGDVAGALMMELVATPVMTYWQSRIARANLVS